MISSLLTIGAKLAAVLETVASWLRSRADQKTGRELQQRDDLAANIKATTDAQAQSDANRALSRDQLIASLHADGAGH